MFFALHQRHIDFIEILIDFSVPLIVAMASTCVVGISKRLRVFGEPVLFRVVSKGIIGSGI